MVLTTKWLTVAEAAKILGLGTCRVRRMADTGVLRCERITYGRLIDPESVQVEMVRRQQKSAERGG